MNLTYSIITAVGGVLLVGIIAASCAVVKTKKVVTNVAKGYVYYYLPESLVKVHATTKVLITYSTLTKGVSQTKIIEQSFVGSTEMVADTRELLALDYRPNGLMHDDIKFAVNAKGLLQSVEATTEDRTANILEAIAKAPAAIASQALAGTKGDEEIKIIKEFSADFQWYADELTSTDKTVAWTINGQLEEEGKPIFSANASFKISTLTRTAKQSAAGGGGIGAGGALPPGSGTSSTTPAAVADSNKSFDGIITRPIIGMRLQVTPSSDITTSAFPIPGNLMIADISKVVQVPIRRSAFAKRINKVTVEDGIVTGNQISKTSSVEGFISIPINIAKLIVSIPAEIIQIKINTGKNREALEKQTLTLQQSIDANTKYIFTKEKELEQVKHELEKARLDNKSAIEVLHLTTQKDLAKAQMDLLQMKQDLADLKKKLEDAEKKP